MTFTKRKFVAFAIFFCIFALSLVSVAVVSATPKNWLDFNYQSKRVEAFLGENVKFASVSPIYPDMVERIYYSVSDPNGDLVENDGVSFIAYSEGEYSVSVCVIGKDGKTYVDTYSVSITKSDRPILVSEPSFPIAYLEGSEYSIPSVQFADYNSQNPMSVSYQTYLIDEFGAESLVGNKLTPSISLHGAEIGIKFVAKSLATNKECVKIFNVPVLKPFELSEYGYREYSYDKMFVTSAVQSSSLKDIGATFYGDNDFSMQYANKLNASFFVALKSEFNRANFNSLTVSFTDSVNPMEMITVEIFNEKNTTVKINGGAPISAKGSLSNFEKGFSLTFNNVSCLLEDTDGKSLGKIEKTVYGTSFKGFSSEFVFVAIQVNNVSSYSAIAVENLNGHKMCKGLESDSILPNVKAAGNFTVKNVLGDTAYIPEAIAYDVIDPCVSAKVSVFGVDVVTSVDGVTLYEADASVGYQVVLDTLGEYIVQYIAEDVNGNVYDIAYYSIFVFDVEGPTISVGNLKQSYSVGEEISVPSISCSDNDTDSDDIIVWITVNYPNGDYKYVTKDSKIKFDKVGVYFIRYTAMDKNNNITTVEQQVVCK